MISKSFIAERLMLQAATAIQQLERDYAANPHAKRAGIRQCKAGCIVVRGNHSHTEYWRRQLEPHLLVKFLCTCPHLLLTSLPPRISLRLSLPHAIPIFLYFHFLPPFGLPCHCSYRPFNSDELPSLLSLAMSCASHPP